MGLTDVGPRIEEDVKTYLEASERLIQPFRESDLAGLTADIMNGNGDFSDIQIPSGTRDVYRLGSFSDGEKDHHAVLKLERNLTDHVGVSFEALFLSKSAGIKNVQPPSFIMLPRVGLVNGIVMEDISEGGRYSLAELRDRSLPFFGDRDYFALRGNHLHALPQIGCLLDFDEGVKMTGREETIEGTSFVVYDDEGFKRIVLADVDQLLKQFAGFTRIPRSEYEVLNGLVFDL